MLESKRNVGAAFPKRLQREKRTAIGFESLVRKSVREDIQRQFRKVLCEAVQYPGDAEWLSEALDEMIRSAHAAAGHPPDRVFVHQDGRDVILSDSQRSIRLVYRGLWKIEHEESDGLDEIAGVLSSWRAFH